MSIHHDFVQTGQDMTDAAFIGHVVKMNDNHVVHAIQEYDTLASEVRHDTISSSKPRRSRRQTFSFTDGLIDFLIPGKKRETNNSL